MLAKFDAQRGKKLLCMDAGLFKSYTSRNFLGIIFLMSCSKLSHLHSVNNVTTWHRDHLESNLGLPLLVVPAAFFP